MQALTSYGLADVELRRVAESFNTVYRVTSGSSIYCLRVGPMQRVHRVGAAVAEANWTRQLAQAGLHVPRVIKALDGSPSVTVSVDGVPAERECVLLNWTPGRPVRRPASVRDVIELAVLSSQLHDAGPNRDTLPDGVLDARSALLFAIPNRLDELQDRFGSLFDDALGAAQAAINDLWHRAKRLPQFLHGDLTFNNVVRCADGMSAIDFQDMMWGLEEQDLANTLFGLRRDDPDGTLAEEFRQAYTSNRPWPELDDALFKQLQIARRLQMVNLALTIRRTGIANFLNGHAAELRKEMK